MKRAKAPDRFAFESDLWRRGVARVAGVDEAGRGPLAGPVVAASVCLPGRWLQDGLPKSLEGLNDSKQLTESRREQYFAVLIGHGEVSYGIAQVEAEQIDEINILQATHLAMNLAIEQIQPGPEHVLVDGHPVKSLRWPQTAIAWAAAPRRVGSGIFSPPARKVAWFNSCLTGRA